MAMSLSTALSTILLAQATPLLIPITAGLPSNFNNVVNISVLTVFPSDRNLLKHGTITTPKNNANASYTILLVGGTGVERSSLLKFIANVLLGNDVDHYDLDILNRPPNKGSAVGQTALPHLYEIMSVSGTLVSARVYNEVGRHNLLIKVRVLNTPGLASIHDTEQDETHKESIVRYIDRHVESLSAVLILAIEDDPVRTEYTFSTLLAIFPKTLLNNIALVFPNSWVFFVKMIPKARKSFPVFILDNPVMGLGTIEKTREHGALETLVALFDWLDDLEPQPVKEIVSLYEKYQNIEAKTIAILNQRAQEKELDRLKTRLKKHSAVSLHIACI